MAIALEGVDLAALAGVLLLIGLLMVVSYTFTRLADVIDVDVFGLHPFRGVSRAIENTIVAGCNSGVEALQDVARTLWHWSTVAIDTLVGGTLDFIAAVGRLWDWLAGDGLSGVIHTAVNAIRSRAEAAWTYADLVNTRVDNAEASLSRTIEFSAAATLATAERNTVALLDGVSDDFTRELCALRTTIEGELAADVAGIGNDVRGALDTLREAEQQAQNALSAVEAATAAELRDLLGSLSAGDVAAIIGAVPLIAALVHTLEAETGLDKAECRQKVKGICGTPTASWLRLLEGLALTAAVSNIDDLIALFQEGTKLVLDEVTPLFTAAR